MPWTLHSALTPKGSDTTAKGFNLPFQIKVDNKLNVKSGPLYLIFNTFGNVSFLCKFFLIKLYKDKENIVYPLQIFVYNF